MARDCFGRDAAAFGDVCPTIQFTISHQLSETYTAPLIVSHHGFRQRYHRRCPQGKDNKSAPGNLRRHRRHVRFEIFCPTTLTVFTNLSAQEVVARHSLL